MKSSNVLLDRPIVHHANLRQHRGTFLTMIIPFERRGRKNESDLFLKLRRSPEAPGRVTEVNFQGVLILTGTLLLTAPCTLILTQSLSLPAMPSGSFTTISVSQSKPGAFPTCSTGKV